MSLQDEKILGLTVWNPWAELIAQGVKTVENRNWAPYDWMLGRFIAIHASKWDQAGADYLRANHPRFALDPPMQSECKQGVLAVVQLVGWVQRQDLGVPPRIVAMMPGHDFAKAEDQLGNSLDWRWFHGAEYGWVLRNAVRFDPVAARGRQKLWKLSSTVYTSVRRRYDVARKMIGPSAPDAPSVTATSQT
jgi:hypothetical protein